MRQRVEHRAPLRKILTGFIKKYRNLRIKPTSQAAYLENLGERDAVGVHNSFILTPDFLRRGLGLHFLMPNR